MKKNTRIVEELFEETKRDVTSILKQLKSLEIGGSVLYFAQKEQIILLVGLKTQLEGAFERTTDERNYKFEKIAKILNPVRAATNYSVGIRGRHRQINDSEKVREKIAAEFAIWKNKTRKDAREYAALHSLDDSAHAALEAEITRRIAEGEAQFAFIDAHFDELDVRIVGYEHEKSYPYIDYSVDGKKHQTHLSITVPNVLYLNLGTFRNDMEVAQFVKEAVHAFGDVYFLSKEE